MTVRTLFALAFLSLSGLAACHSSDDTDRAGSASPEVADWRLASGKAPTKAEFNALTATCQARGGAADTCLADLGLKRAP